MEIPTPATELRDIKHSLERIGAYYQHVEDDRASLLGAWGTVWELVGLLPRIGATIDSIAEWLPRDLERYERLTRADIDRSPDEHFEDGEGEGDFEQSREALADLYLISKALRRVELLLRDPKSIDLNRLERE